MEGPGAAPRHPRTWPDQYSLKVPSTSADTALLFPGQGSQTSTMTAFSASRRPDVGEKSRVELAADPFEQISEGTHFAQPALFIAGLAHWKAAGEPDARYYAGPLPGE